VVSIPNTALRTALRITYSLGTSPLGLAGEDHGDPPGASYEARKASLSARSVDRDASS
jgi:hypothetical protein